MHPKTEYAKSGDVHVAYQVLGDGPLDLVLVPGFVSHVEHFWEDPALAGFLRRLASFSRLIFFDKRGTGLSDRVSEAALPTLEERMDDVRAVLDAARSERAAFFAPSDAGSMAILFAATYPERATALVLYGTFAAGVKEPGYPWGATPPEWEESIGRWQEKWGREAFALERFAFEPPVGTERLREFIDNRWGERTPRTRAKVISVLRDFFAWAVRERGLTANPALPIFRPRKREVARGTFTQGDVRKLIAAQSRLRDRVAVLLLFRLGLRKSELARVQFAHYDGRNLTVFGKGGKVRYLPVVDRELREALERHILDRQPSSDEFLLYPEKLGPEFYRGPVGVIWQDRCKQLSSTAMHRWWIACVKRAGIAHRPMHEARHTAITEFLRSTGNLKLAQMLAGHADIGTTANIYAHLDTTDLETALKALNEEPS